MNSPVDLPRAIDAAIENTIGLAGPQPVAVVAECPAHLPAIRGDQTALINVIASLIARSVRSSAGGEVKVRAAVLSPDEPVSASQGTSARPRAVTEGGPWVQIMVSGVRLGPEAGDVGVASRGSDSGGGGAPMSLDRCRSVIRSFGGHLWAEPDAPSVCLVLPFQAAATEPDVSSLRRSLESRLPGGAKTPHTLLLVADNTELGDLLSRDLTAAGYGVMLSGNGTDGLAIARRARPDLVLLDLMVRQPSAFDVAMLLKQDRRTRNTPVLFVTLVSDPQTGISVRAVNYLVRPSGTGALVAAVNALLTSGVSPSARVLVVEPDAGARDMMVMMIQSHGYRVTEATGPEEALALAERVALGLILVNARLAQDRDYWLLRNLRQVSADAGIYVLADGLSDADGRAAVSRGASGYGDTGRLPELLERVRERTRRR